jgi:hypothetical protein
MNETTKSPRFVIANKFVIALCNAGIIQEPADTISRVIIDAAAGQMLKLYITKYGDTRMVEIIESAGVEIIETEVTPPAA